MFTLARKLFAARTRKPAKPACPVKLGMQGLEVRDNPSGGLNPPIPQGVVLPKSVGVPLAVFSANSPGPGWNPVPVAVQPPAPASSPVGGSWWTVPLPVASPPPPARPAATTVKLPAPAAPGVTPPATLHPPGLTAPAFFLGSGVGPNVIASYPPPPHPLGISWNGSISTGFASPPPTPAVTIPSSFGGNPEALLRAVATYLSTHPRVS